MSPTSYQAAPPRECIIAEAWWFVKRSGIGERILGRLRLIYLFAVERQKRKAARPKGTAADKRKGKTLRFVRIILRRNFSTGERSLPLVLRHG
jgi:hypothetical protein